MCLLVLAWKVHPHYRLIVAANRDEFHERPTAAMAPWPAPTDILAGRDLRSGGTWLGLDRTRRFAVVTNFRDLQRPHPETPSRGRLIPDYLGGAAGPGDFLRHLRLEAGVYSGFNLLLSDSESLWYATNRAGPAHGGRGEATAEIPGTNESFARVLQPGIYGLSNQFLDTPWPKLQRVRQRFETWLADESQAGAETLFEMLNDRATVSVDSQLPRTGLSTEWERILSSPFVLNPDYGTRCSTVLLLRPSGAVELTERRFDPQGRLNGESRWQLEPGEWP